MKRAAWVVPILLLAMALAVAGDTGCGCVPDEEPLCYTSVRSNEIIGFRLIIPVDYFWKYETSETPLITGWWVERPDGIVVKYVQYTEVRGHWESFTWDLTDDNGELVEPGFYRIVMTTTSAPPAIADVQIVSCCCSPCWGCCPALQSCYRSPCCYAPYGEPRLSLESVGTRSCCLLNISIFGSFEEP